MSIIRSDIKIRSDIRIRVEAILRDYPDLETYIKNRKRELMIPHREIDENVGGGKSSKISKPQEQMIITIDADRRLKTLEREKSAIEKCFFESDADTQNIIKELYFKKYREYTVEGLSFNHIVNCSVRTVKRLKSDFLLKLAHELDIYEP
ncbi:transcriptional regulator [Companilactobacillus alimentarius]|uniref:transcriptional regulator n=1 Tax=Companilactobacillus alimentarius TaxID=1602 RepID=UPI0028B66303|nr:transcriptional regulator [Companilactobacillus alimentarius]MDT6951846.1 transcriptional regulator [Companilactobacillus alimentarius]